MDKEKKLTASEKKKMETLDRKIERLEKKICANRQEYDAMAGELKKLLDEKYPERKPEKIKNRLYDAYIQSDRSIDEIIAFMEDRSGDIDW